MGNKKQVRLENWKRCHINERIHFLEGEVYEHPEFPDGHTIFTSKILNIADDESTAETLNTIYKLGKKAFS